MSDKVKFELEFLMKKTSPKVLFNMLSTPSGLSEWFADDVNIKDDVYTFFWDGSEESAKLVTKKVPEYVKFQWEDDEDEGNDAYFQFAIKIDPMTNDTALVVTDHAEEDDVEEARMLWENQVGDLMHILGA